MEKLLSQLVSIHNYLFVSLYGELLQYSLFVDGLTKAVYACAGCLVWSSGLSHGAQCLGLFSIQWHCHSASHLTFPVDLETTVEHAALPTSLCPLLNVKSS